MKLDDILTNEDLRRRAFPVTRSRIYFAHAAVSPLPACVERAMRNYLRQAARVGQFEHLHRDAEQGARSAAAELLGVTPEEIAFVPSTSAGLGLVAEGLEWRPGDNVVILDGDFPANVHPWLHLGRRGVQVRRIAAALDRPLTLTDLSGQLDERTRLVSLPSIHYVTGTPVDIDTVGAYLRGRGILFCVDAIQSFGAVPCSARCVDFLAADGHKWLLGPQGMGVLVVRRAAFRLMQPALVGWKSVQAATDFHVRGLPLADSARRYEPGSLNAVGLVGLRAALELLQEIGIGNISAHLNTLREVLVEGLRDLGYLVLGPRHGLLPTGITSFQCPGGRGMAALHKKLDEQGCIVSLRKDQARRECIRVSPHFYNRVEEVRAFLDILGPACSTY